jgi:hypothetical protein
MVRWCRLRGHLAPGRLFPTGRIVIFSFCRDLACDWVILLHIALPDGTKLERQIDVRGVRPK